MGGHTFDAILSPEKDSGYSVEIPALPGCFTSGDDYSDAAYMAAYAARIWIASAMKHSDIVPSYSRSEILEGCERITVFFEADQS